MSWAIASSVGVMCGHLTDWFASGDSFDLFFSLSSDDLDLVKRIPWKMLERLALIVELPWELPVRALIPSVVENGRGNGFGGSEVTWKNDTGLFGLLRSMLSWIANSLSKDNVGGLRPVCGEDPIDCYQIEVWGLWAYVSECKWSARPCHPLTISLSVDPASCADRYALYLRPLGHRPFQPVADVLHVRA